VHKRADFGNPDQFTLRLWTENSFFGLRHKFGLAIEVKVRLCLAVFWGSEGMLRVLLQVLSCYTVFSNSLSPQTKSNVNDLFFWSTLVALSGWSSEAQNYKFGFVQIDLCHTDWYCQRQLLLSCVTNWHWSEETSVTLYWDCLRESLPPCITNLESSKMMFVTYSGIRFESGSP